MAIYKTSTNACEVAIICKASLNLKTIGEHSVLVGWSHQQLGQLRGIKIMIENYYFKINYNVSASVNKHSFTYLINKY